MKFFSLLLAAAVSFIVAAPAVAGPQPKDRPVYSATVSGMTCLQCKRFVKQSFAKLEGVDEATFTFDTGTVQGTTVVSFASTSAGLTKDQAVKSLGDRAKRYVVTEFVMTGAKDEADSGGAS